MSNNKKLFPEELLNKSKDERKEFFSNFSISHLNLKKVKEQLIRIIKDPSGIEIVLVIGPSGVGKSLLFINVMDEILAEMIPELEEDKCRIPIAGIEVVSPEDSKFSWKDFYYRQLSALTEPLIDRKIDLEKFKKDRSKQSLIPKSYHSSTVPELRRSLENAFKYRRPLAFLIDEAQHIFKAASSKRLLDQFDSLKSLSNMNGVVYVLFGTYELAHVINLSAQLSRRVKEIHFPRYMYEDKLDLKNFIKVIQTFEKALPFEKEPSLHEHYKYIYKNTIGCVGVLKNWLERCLADALESNEETITLDILKRNAHSQKKVMAMIEEATNGEADFYDNEDVDEDLEILMGIKKKEKKVDKKDSKRNPNPGKRNPTRDDVGA